jgi:molecular chaperone DnaK (HSP70)
MTWTKAAGGFSCVENQGARRAGNLRPDLPMLSRIREAAELAKIKLSTETEVEIALPFLTPDFPSVTNSRARNWKI